MCFKERRSHTDTMVLITIYIHEEVISRREQKVSCHAVEMNLFPLAKAVPLFLSLQCLKAVEYCDGTKDPP